MAHRKPIRMTIWAARTTPPKHRHLVSTMWLKTHCGPINQRYFAAAYAGLNSGASRSIMVVSAAELLQMKLANRDSDIADRVEIGGQGRRGFVLPVTDDDQLPRHALLDFCFEAGNSLNYGAGGQ